MAEEPIEDVELPGRPVSFEGLRAALGRPPVWIVAWGLVTLLALTAALPWYRWFAGVTAHRFEVGSMIGQLDQNFRADFADTMGVMKLGTSQAGAILAFVAFLLGVFFAGGWLQIFLERSDGHSLRRFFYGGARYFWRFFRFLILLLLVMAVVSWVIYDKPWEVVVLDRLLGIPKGDYGSLESLDSEWNMRLLRWGQDGLYALAFGLVLVWGIYSRARLALHDASSAIWAGFCTFFMILRHPFRTLTPMIVILFTQGIVLLLALVLRSWIEGDLSAESGPGRVIAIFAATQILPLLWANVAFGARYYVAVKVSREIVPRVSRPDPWKSSIGGPGGPRYPLGGGDEYGVSL